VAITFTTFTSTDTVGVFVSVLADDSLAEVEVLVALAEVCCASNELQMQSSKRVQPVARELNLPRGNVPELKDMINTMPEWRRVHSKGL
jgi:hypothetical protein